MGDVATPGADLRELNKIVNVEMDTDETRPGIVQFAAGCEVGGGERGTRGGASALVGKKMKEEQRREREIERKRKRVGYSLERLGEGENKERQRNKRAKTTTKTGDQM